MLLSVGITALLVTTRLVFYFAFRRMTRSSISVPLQFAVFGMFLFVFIDAASGKLFSQIISNYYIAQLCSFLIGAPVGYLYGRYVVRKAGLPLNAIPAELHAVARAMRRVKN